MQTEAERFERSSCSPLPPRPRSTTPLAPNRMRPSRTPEPSMGSLPALINVDKDRRVLRTYGPTFLGRKRLSRKFCARNPAPTSSVSGRLLDLGQFVPRPVRSNPSWIPRTRIARIFSPSHLFGQTFDRRLISGLGALGASSDATGCCERQAGSDWRRWLRFPGL